jgi:hypothetical protein
MQRVDDDAELQVGVNEWLKNSLRLWLSNVYNKKCFFSLGFFLFQNVSYFLDSPRILDA